MNDRQEPSLPDAGERTVEVWPSERRELLGRLATAEHRRREDLTGQHGAADGSGTSDALIFQAGDYCLKTSPRRCFSDPVAARAAMSRLARKKQLIMHLLPDDTVICLRHEGDGATWLWTIARWVTTLRAAMSRAERQCDELALGEVLAAFATAAVDAMVLNATRSVVLDVHPSNFGSLGERLFYVDDDIGLGPRNPAVGHALLRRFEEYARFPAATRSYLSRLEQQIATRLAPDQLVALELVAALEATPVRSDAAHEARAQLCRRLARYTAPVIG